jgi:hypothetical protein
MAWEKPGHQIALVATADLSSSQFCAVDVDSSAQAALPSNHGRAVGVVQNKPKLGAVADVMVDGVTKMVAAGAITKGANITVNASGQAVAAATGNIILGIALDTGAASAIIPVLLMQQGVSA